MKNEIKKAIEEREAKKKLEKQRAEFKSLGENISEVLGKQQKTLEKIERKKYPTSVKIIDGIIDIKKGIEITNLKSLNGLKVEITNPVSKLEITNPVREISINKPVELAEPKWFKPFDNKAFTKTIFKGLVEIYKAITLKVTADKHQLPKNALAVKIVNSKGKYVDLAKQLQTTPVQWGGGSGGGTTGGATEATLQNVLTELQSINNKINIYIDNETPNGNIDGTNDTFTTHYNYKPNTTKVYLNGVRQSEGTTGDYIESGTNEIVFTTNPQTNDIILVDYIKN